MSVSVESTVKAIHALSKYSESKKSEEKPQLFEVEEYVHLEVYMDHSEKKQSNVFPSTVHLPYPIYERDSVDVCLIVKSDDLERIKELLEKTPIPAIKRVMTASELKSDYSQFKDRRELCNSFELFLADQRLKTMLIPLLGKSFFNKNKYAIPVNLTGKATKEVIQRCIESTFMFPNNKIVDVKVGLTSTNPTHVAENANSVIKAILSKCPDSKIQSISIKSSNSLSFPLYDSLFQ